eukprot:485760_1
MQHIKDYYQQRINRSITNLAFNSEKQAEPLLWNKTKIIFSDVSNRIRAPASVCPLSNTLQECMPTFALDNTKLRLCVMAWDRTYHFGYRLQLQHDMVITIQYENAHKQTWNVPIVMRAQSKVTDLLPIIREYFG